MANFSSKYSKLIKPFLYIAKSMVDICLFIPIPTIRIVIIKCLKGVKLSRHVFVARCIDIRGLKHNLIIGSNTVINKNVILDRRGGDLIIGNNVDIAQEVNIWTLEHDVNDDYHREIGANVIIEDYVWIASRATILPGVKIGRGAVVACNSVVTKDVASMKIVGGIPAKEIGERKSNLLYTLKV
jgi:maltose O-acetyltransferase